MVDEIELHCIAFPKQLPPDLARFGQIWPKNVNFGRILGPFGKDPGMQCNAISSTIFHLPFSSTNILRLYVKIVRYGSGRTNGQRATTIYKNGIER